MQDTSVARQEVERLLTKTASFHKLDKDTQVALRDGMSKVAAFLAQNGGAAPSRQMGPDLSSLRSGGAPSSSPPPPSSTSPSPTPAGPVSGGTAPPGGGATARAGEVARATLNAIDFPSFVASLIQGTFQAIVDASIKQMEAYSELLKNAALTVDSFMNDNVTDGTARDYLADRFDSVVTRDTSGDAPKLTLTGNANAPLPSFFQDLGFSSVGDIDDESLDSKVIPATKRMLAEQRQQTLATMVLMGINRIVVSDGEISAKLQFHIDASEHTQMRFDEQKNTVGAYRQSQVTGQAIMVNTTSLNAQSDLNVRTDLVGSVTVRFKSETFPLERFADSAAIQLISTRAKVPAAPQQQQQQQQQPQQLPPAAPSAPTAPAPPPKPISQSSDPWAPRGQA